MTSVPPTRLLAALQAADPATAERLMRDAIAALLHWQVATPAHGLLPLERDTLHSELDLFAAACQGQGATAWGEREQATWARCSTLLVDHALQQAERPVAVHGGWSLAELLWQPDGTVTPASGGHAAHAGAAGSDLADLLRDGSWVWDEPQELDGAVRWWDAARRVGLPVGDDFGECWRAHEWLGLQRQLVRLGRLLAEPHADLERAATRARLLASTSRVALRYGPLKPLLRLLEPLSGTSVAAGFTF